MSAIILAPIKITNASGTVSFGGVFYNSPVSTSKSASGSGGGNTGDFSTVNNFFSVTFTIDPDVSDSNNLGNA